MWGEGILGFLNPNHSNFPVISHHIPERPMRPPVVGDFTLSYTGYQIHANKPYKICPFTGGLLVITAPDRRKKMQCPKDTKMELQSVRNILLRVIVHRGPFWSYLSLYLSACLTFAVACSPSLLNNFPLDLPPHKD